MLRHHTGSGRRTVIPSDWSAHHRPALDGTRTATVSLRRPGGTRGDFDIDTGTYPTTPHAAYYSGSARIQVLPTGSGDQLAAEQEITTLSYAVMLDDALTGVQLDDLVTVDAVDANGDTWLVGRELTVIRVESGSLHWERRLVCTDNLETPDETPEA